MGSRYGRAYHSHIFLRRQARYCQAHTSQSMHVRILSRCMNASSRTVLLLGLAAEEADRLLGHDIAASMFSHLIRWMFWLRHNGKVGQNLNYRSDHVNFLARDLITCEYVCDMCWCMAKKGSR